VDQIHSPARSTPSRISRKKHFRRYLESSTSPDLICRQLRPQFRRSPGPSSSIGIAHRRWLSHGFRQSHQQRDFKRPAPSSRRSPLIATPDACWDIHTNTNAFASISCQQDIQHRKSGTGYNELAPHTTPL
jgi:hypothetical protein